MRLKPHKNIDEEIQLPRELEFRQEAVWNKIQTKKERSPSNAIFYWFGAASVAFLLGLFFFGTEKEEVDDSQMITGRSTKEVIFDLKTEKTPFLNIDESPNQIEVAQKRLSDERKGVVENLTEDSTLTIFPRKVAQIEVLQLNDLEVIEEKQKELSPAALHLQKSLAKLNKDKSADQVLFVEKFNLLNELNIGKVQASTNTLPNSIFQSIKKESNEKN